MDVSFAEMLQKLKTFWSKTNRWHRAIFVFLIVQLKLVPGRQLGFYCGDPALSHPFTGDTITWKWLLGITALLPLAVLLIVERVYHIDTKTKRHKKQAWHWYKEYLFGTLLHLILIQSLKMMVGSPRPHFFDTCSPKEALTCEGSEYVSSYTCTKAHWLSQSDRSFPSGHTSLGLQSGLFIAYYLHRRTLRPRSRSIITFQVLSVVTAVFCSLSRIMDRRHHWWDVLGGAFISVPVLLYIILSRCEDFNCPSPNVEETQENGCSVPTNKSDISLPEASEKTI